MSVVTGVMVFCTCGEDSTCDSDWPVQFELLNTWLRQQGCYGELVAVDTARTGGTKNPQFNAAAAGFNYFAADDFAAVFLSLQWDFPENALLVMQPEDGPTIVVRPC